MNGILNVLKPPGMTSHDVVNFVRRTLSVARAGHTGTLDPGASGVLVVCLGSATKIVRFLMDGKEYRAEITFGISTATGDVFGEVTKRSDASSITLEKLEETLSLFRGDILQIPPMTSAIKMGGKKLYELARRGIEVERQPRPVKIYSLRVLGGQGWGTPHPKALLSISCSGGTYVRALCADIGEKLGCGAHMSFLVRTKVGTLSIDGSVTLEEIASLASKNNIDSEIIGIDEVLNFLPEVQLKRGAVIPAASGSLVYPPGVSSSLPGISPGSLVRLKFREQLIAIARAVPYGDTVDVLYKPLCVLSGGPVFFKQSS